MERPDSDVARMSGTADGPENHAPLSLRERFLRDGYVVLREAVPPALCRQAVEAFEKEVKGSRRFFLRHASSRWERHEFTPEGFMKYPIMNIQDLSPREFPRFRAFGLEVLTSPALKEAVAQILGERGRIIHTMFFDGNQQTWAHRDSHYIDSETVGAMIGAWVAAEDIHPGAGRFYVYAGSHRIETPADLALDAVDPNSVEYKGAMQRWCEESGLERVAPELRCGDVILWSSLTIHGSLATTEPTRSRKSFTTHYIPESHGFLWMRRSRGSNREIQVNGTRISRHDDQGHWTVQTRAKLHEYLQGHCPQVLSAARTARRKASLVLRPVRSLLAGREKRAPRPSPDARH